MTVPLPRLAWLLVGLMFVALPRVARADDPATRTARRHFEQGEKLFALGRFDEALDEYQDAFDAKPIPAFLFNIGQCYRNLGDYDQAIFSFKKYLHLRPDAPNRDAVEDLIDKLEEKRERGEGHRRHLDGGTKPPPPPPRVVVTSTPIYKRWWFWTGIAVVAGAGGFGVYEAVHGGPPSTDLGNLPGVGP